jgi:hypothetical protein
MEGEHNPLLLEYICGDSVPQSYGINSNSAQDGVPDRLLTWADAFDGPALQPITFFAQSQSQKFALLTYRRSRIVEQLGLGVNFVTSNRSFTYRCLCSGTAIQNLQLV